ncbi:hypothetical protein PRIPAC_79464 [Pristionchus pacificus]|uniref:G protein-coupled receptor n=1 Tax=Pristionchus pacificus TaxID=54126 RepID=A0A2A6CJS1_PRIPA|nr:hypothetical protein PRIPAC_79464 [Pristionchus pacificus]|eukprot:PDM78293.1 G protein-coupled receptor [Pristionchus pacificus]
MSAEQCKLLDELSSSVAYQGIVAVKCILCFIGAVGISYQWNKQGSRFLVHENSQILFNFYYLNSFIVSFMFTIFYLFELFRLRHDCYVIQFKTVLFVKMFADCGLFGAHFIIIALSLERLYSSFFPAHFEKKSNKKLAFCEAIGIVAVSWMYITSPFSNNFTLFYDTRLVALIDERIPENMNNFEEVMTVINASSIFSFLLLFVDIYMNFYRKSSIIPSLSVSYQRSENRRVILTILPVEFTAFFLALIGVSTQIVQMNFIGMSSPLVNVLIMELTFHTMLNPLITAIIIEWRTSKNRPVVTNNIDGVYHFESLRYYWT